MASFKVLAVLFLFSLSYADAIRCLSCTDILQPHYCSGIENCAEGDACVTESYRNRNGVILYNVGCMSKQRCSLNALHSSSTGRLRHDIIGTHDHDVCTECCHGDLCNAAGCGTHGFPQQRGPICLSCPQSRNTTDCDVVSVCLQGEVCHIEEVTMFSEVFFKTGCVRQNDYECTRPPVYNPLEVGKRSDRRGKCFYCCSTDLCNINCNHDPSSTDYTTTYPTTSTTVSTTVTPCKQGWITSKEKCYYVSTESEKTDWETARNRCISMGAKLVEIKTDEEGTFLMGSMPNRVGNTTEEFIYTGRERNDADEWVFISDNARVNTTERPWPRSRPLGGVFKCGCTGMYYNFAMLDCQCIGFRLFYICETIR